MKAKLLIRKGLAAGEEIPLPSAPLVIGRGEEADLRLPDRAASREHCRIEPDGGAFRVRDMGSKNGTCLNGLPVTSAPLGLGDLLTVGLTTLQVLPDDALSSEATRLLSHEDGGPSETLSLAPAPAASGAGERLDRRTVTDVAALVEEAWEAGEETAFLDRLTEGLLRLTGASRGAALVRPPGGGTLRTAAAPGLADEASLALGRETVERCLSTGRGLLFTNLGVDPSGREAEQAVRLFYEALCAPLGRPDRPAGVLYLDSLGADEALGLPALDAAVLAGRLAGLHARCAAPAPASGTAGGPEANLGMMGSSAVMLELFETVRKAAGAPSTVLLRGESGTGKELVARALHRCSPRRDGPFVAVNCAALPAGLVESELFGHEKGAFTGATRSRPGRFVSASGGVLFLDEVGELPPESQGKLLRAVEEKRVRPLGGSGETEADVRLVAATNRDLAAAVKEGRFREDLYYRLSVIAIEVPPLREREGDVERLASYFLEALRAETGHKVEGFSDEALSLLGSYRWPGNVRELRNVVERSVVLASGRRVEARDLGFLPPGPAEGEAGAVTLREAEKRHVLSVLRASDWNKSRAARTLGIERSTLYEKIRAYGLSREGER